MPILKVFFMGLICHVGKDNGKERADHAAFLDAPGHTPEYVLFDPVQNAPFSTKIPKGTTIKFKIGAAQPTEQAVPFDKTFRTNVLKLSEIIPADGKVKADVQDRSNKSDVAAYVVYPADASKLMVADLYNHTARHHKTSGGVKREGCLARITMTEITAADRITVVGLPQELTFTQDACILFTNGEPKDSLPQLQDDHVRDAQERKISDPSDCHTFFYGNIATKPVEVICEDVQDQHCPQTVSVPKDCGWVEKYVGNYRARASEFIECGNTQWP